jgi:hypothetical protein
MARAGGGAAAGQADGSAGRVTLATNQPSTSPHQPLPPTRSRTVVAVPAGLRPSPTRHVLGVLTDAMSELGQALAGTRGQSCRPPPLATPMHGDHDAKCVCTGQVRCVRCGASTTQATPDRPDPRAPNLTRSSRLRRRKQASHLIAVGLPPGTHVCTSAARAFCAVGTICTAGSLKII